MTLGSYTFKRIVLGLLPQPPDYTMRLAVDLADLLNLELLGLFLEEASLRNLANIPFAREYRPLGGGWHPIDVAQLARDMELAASTAERIFTEAAKRLAARSRFEVIRGSTAETIASISQSGDIVMIMEPESPVARATQQFSWLIDAAFLSAAAVMLVPSRIIRTKGPIVAIAAAPNDPSIDAAAAIAMAAHEELIIAAAYDVTADDLSVRERVAGLGLTIKHFVAGKIARPDPERFSHVFRELKERLLVMAQGSFDRDVALRMTSARRVPLLLVKPAEGAQSDAAPAQLQAC